MERNFHLNLSQNSPYDQQLRDMREQNVAYVHGSNSNSFTGLVIFRALLSAEERHGTSWFDRRPVQSGERGYTLESLHTNQPIAMGVSLNLLSMFSLSINIYANYGTDGNVYPVLYGIDGTVELDPRTLEHPISKRGISIDKISAVYVPEERIPDAKNSLGRLPHVQARVRRLILTPRARGPMQQPLR